MQNEIECSSSWSKACSASFVIQCRKAVSATVYCFWDCSHSYRSEQCFQNLDEKQQQKSPQTEQAKPQQ